MRVTGTELSRRSSFLKWEEVQNRGGVCLQWMLFEGRVALTVHRLEGRELGLERPAQAATGNPVPKGRQFPANVSLQPKAWSDLIAA